MNKTDVIGHDFPAVTLPGVITETPWNADSDSLSLGWGLKSQIPAKLLDAVPAVSPLAARRVSKLLKGGMKIITRHQDTHKRIICHMSFQILLTPSAFII